MVIADKGEVLEELLDYSDTHAKVNTSDA